MSLSVSGFTYYRLDGSLLAAAELYGGFTEYKMHLHSGIGWLCNIKLRHYHFWYGPGHPDRYGKGCNRCKLYFG